MQQPRSSEIVIHVPVRFTRRGGRRLIFTPDSAPLHCVDPEHDDTIIKALLRAHRWNRMLENGKASSITQLAHQERINSSYLARVLRLTLLAPDITSAILDGRQPKGLRLIDILKPFPMLWDEQKKWFGFIPNGSSV